MLFHTLIQRYTWDFVYEKQRYIFDNETRTFFEAMATKTKINVQNEKVKNIKKTNQKMHPPFVLIRMKVDICPLFNRLK